MKKVQHNPFAFLNQGNDSQFDNAMNNVNSLYDQLFRDDSKDQPVLQSIKENNLILQPISQMNQAIFHTNQKILAKGQPAYHQVFKQDQYQDFVYGEPIYSQETIKMEKNNIVMAIKINNYQ